jgi:small subunit ribosomal protein S9
VSEDGTEMTPTPPSAETGTVETGAEAPIEMAVETAAPQEPVNGYHWGTGRRKTAVARVRIRPGEGTITINGRDYQEHFPTLRARNLLLSPLLHTKTINKYDVFVNIRGGGVISQAGAVVLGISRALVKVQPEIERALRADGYLTRDPREKERKKYGRRGARRSFQFSKR